MATATRNMRTTSALTLALLLPTLLGSGGCAVKALTGSPNAHAAGADSIAAIASKVERLSQHIESVGSRVDASRRENDDTAHRLMAIGLATTAILGYLPGKVAWKFFGSLNKKKGAKT